MKLKNLQEVDFKDKEVLLRVDLDVPLVSRKINDDMRLKASIETLDYLLREAKKVIIIGHLGRPKGRDQGFTLRVVGQWYEKEFKGKLKKIEHKGFEAFEILPNLILLENLRFFKEEEENPSTSSGQVFAQKLASLADIYVNDAFASSHRPHASIVGITKYLPSFAGFRLQKEVEELSKVLEKPKRPMAIILGGAKIETKLPLVEKMHHFADYVLVGGEIAENTKVLLKVQHEKLKGKKSALIIADLTKDLKDITPKSAENFLQIAQICETIVWNGPMGMVEEEKSKQGTLSLAKGLLKILSFKVVGGGDTLSFLKEENLLENYSFVSIGGGAMLEFLAGEKLPGLIVLEK